MCPQTNGECTTADQEKTDVLVNYFTVLTQEPEGQWQLLEAPVPINKLDIDLTETAIDKLLNDINISKYAGPDGVPPRPLHDMRSILSKPQSIMFTTSIRTGVLPAEWKQAGITAIHKKENKSISGNYRPISLTSIICKLLVNYITGSPGNSLVSSVTDRQYYN